MHKLYTKIFLTFWLAMALISTISIVLTLTTDLGKQSHERRQRRYRLNSQELISTLKDGGVAAYQHQTQELNQKYRIWGYLYRNNEGTVDGFQLPQEIVALARLAGQSQVTQVHSGETFIWVAYPATTEFTYVVKKIRPSQLERILGLKDLGIHLGITLIIVGLTCYLLARSLTAPIIKLRQATQRFSAGELSTRVSDTISGHNEITELAGDFDQMAERIEDLVNSQHHLVRNISHELRSPLTRLNLAVEMVRRAEGPDREKLLERIKRESSRLNELIGQILTLALLRDGAGQIIKKPLNLQPLVMEIVRDANFEAKELGHGVIFHGQSPASLNGSRELLRQAIENVVRNAVRCEEEGSDVEVFLETRHDKLAVITVRDFGPGVQEAALDKLFLPFYRGEADHDRHSGGSGVGLAITERAVSLHGGRVHATNHPEGGLEVTLEIPLAAPT